MSTRKDVRSGLIYELLGEMMAPIEEKFQSGIMERGHMVEEVVKDTYYQWIESVWFCRRTDIPYIGISPDVVVIKKNRFVRALEVKGPAPKQMMKCWLSPSIPEEYFWQVVHYFVVFDDLETLDFVACSPDMYDEYFRKRTITVTREELQESIDLAKEALEEFHEEFLAIAETCINLKPKYLE